MNYSQDTILNLSDDCIFEILSFIDNIREKVQLRKVCKRFNNVVQLYFQSHDIALCFSNIYYQSEEQNSRTSLVVLDFFKVINQCPRIREINNALLNIKWSKYQIQQIPRLKSLILECFNIALKRRKIETLIWRCVNLRALVLSNFQSSIFNPRCLSNQLNELSLLNCELSYQSIRNLLNKIGSKLVIFKFVEGTFSTSQPIVSLIAHTCSKLEYLSIPASKIGPINELCTLSNLKELYLEDLVEYINASGMYGILHRCTQLKRVDITLEPVNLDFFLWMFVDNCQLIEYIDLHLSYELTKLGYLAMNAIYTLKHLRELNKYPKEALVK